MCLVLTKLDFEFILRDLMQEQLDKKINLLTETKILRVHNDDIHNKEFSPFALVSLANLIELESFT